MERRTNHLVLAESQRNLDPVTKFVDPRNVFFFLKSQKKHKFKQKVHSAFLKKAVNRWLNMPLFLRSAVL